MATINTITDEYILRPRIDDQASAGVDAFTARLGKMEQQASAAAGAAGKVADSMRDAAGRVSDAATTFDKYAARYDAVTKAANLLARAQKDLQTATDAGARAMGAGLTTQQQVDVTTAGLAKRVAELAEKYGIARANAVASAEGQAAWNAQIAGGSAAVTAMADKIASAAQVAQSYQRVFQNWLTGGMSQDAQIQKFNANLAQFAASLDQLAQQYDPLRAASQRYAGVLGDLQKLEDYGVMSAERLAIARENAAKSMAGETQTLLQQRAAIDPLVASSLAYETQLNNIQAAADAGAISQERATQLMADATAAFGKANAPLGTLTDTHKKLGNETWNTTFATRQAGVQMVQFGSQVATGSPILLAAIQQFHQMWDVAIATGTGFKVLGDAAKAGFMAVANFAMANPIITAIVAIGGALAYITYSAETWNRAQMAMQAQVSATRDDYATAAKDILAASRDVSQATDASAADAAKVALAFRAMPGVAQGALTGLTKLVVDLSRAMGTDLPAATKVAQQALTDPAKAAMDLASAEKPLRTLDAALVDTITHLQAIGDKAGASLLVMKALGETAARGAQQVTPLTGAWHDLDVAMHTFNDSSKGVWQTIGENVASGLAIALTAINRIIDGIHALQHAMLDFNTWLMSTQYGQAYQKSLAGTSGGQAGGGTIGTGGAGASMSASQQFDLWSTYGGAVPSVQAGPQGGIGTMQLVQSTANAYGVNPFIASDNVLGGMSYIKDLWGQTGGSWDTARAYKEGPTGMNDPRYVVRGNAYAASVAQADISKLPQDTAALIDLWGQVLTMTPEQIAFGKRVAMVESNGRQGAVGNQMSVGPAAAVPVASSYGGTTLTPEEQQRQLALKGVGDLSQVNTVNASIEKTVQTIRELNAAREAIYAKPTLSDDDTARIGAYNKAIAQQDVSLQHLLNPMLTETQALQDQAVTASVLSDAQRAVLDVQLKIDALNRDNPQHQISQADAMKLVSAQYGLLDQQGQKFLNQAGLQITANEAMADAWDQGTSEAGKQKIAHDALIEAMKHYDQTAPDFIEKVKGIEIAMQRVAGSDAAGAVKQMTTQTREQAEATTRVAAAWDGSAASLDHLQNLEKARAALAPQYFEDEKARAAAIQTYAASMDSASAANRVFQQEQASVTAVAQGFTTAFDNIGNAITQAFVSTGGQAVKWGNVMKATLTQVIDQIIKLGVIVPITNALFGQNNGTLGTAIDVLGRSSSGSGSGSGSGFGGVSNMFSLSSTGNTLSGAFGGPTLQSALGFGSSATAAPAGFEAVGGGSTLLVNPTTGMYMAGPTTGTLMPTVMGAGLGAWAGGIGGGFALGSMAGGAIQGALNKTGPAPMIGAGLGAVGGATIGTMILPGIGTIIGGLLGGTLGGAGGGLIGPHVASPYSSQMMGLSGGMLSTGAFLSQRDPNAQAEQAAFLQQAIDINKLLQANNVFISQQKGMIQLGDNTPGGFQDPTKWADLNATNITGKTALQQYRFSSADPLLAQKLSTQDFATTTQLQTYLTGFSQAQAQTKEFLSETTAMLKNLGATTGSVGDTISQLNAAFDANKSAGDALINSGFLSDDQITQMVAAENQLSDARDRAVKATVDAANAQITATDQGLTYRQMTAQASISGSARDAVAAQLYQFDAGAQPQRDQLSAAIVSLYGDTIKNTQFFADQMAMLETTLSKERLAIVTQGNAQIAAQDAAAAAKDATGGSAAMSAAIQTAQQSFQTAQQALVVAINADITKTQALITATQNQVAVVQQNSTALHAAVDSLHSFNQGLKIGATSPLTPAQQLAAAQAAFAADLAKAKSGDLTAAQAVQSDASSYLQQAQTYYGGATKNYQAVFTTVTGSLSGLETAVTAQASVADRQLVDLNAQLDTQKKQLGVQQQQVAVAQAVGTRTQLSIGQLTANMMTAFKSLQGAFIAAGQDPANAGRTQAQAQASLRTAALSQAQNVASATRITDATSALAALDQIQQLMLGRPTLSANRATRAAQLMSGTATLTSIIGENLASAEYKQFWGLAGGGWVGNGLWGKDSVRAAYAGGGTIALAGGEFVVSAPQAARYAELLPKINRGTLANDNSSSAALLAEVKALRAELARLTQVTALSGQTVHTTIEAGNRLTRQQVIDNRLRPRA